MKFFVFFNITLLVWGYFSNSNKDLRQKFAWKKQFRYICREIAKTDLKNMQL